MLKIPRRGRESPYSLRPQIRTTLQLDAFFHQIPTILESDPFFGRLLRSVVFPLFLLEIIGCKSLNRMLHTWLTCTINSLTVAGLKKIISVWSMPIETSRYRNGSPGKKYLKDR